LHKLLTPIIIDPPPKCFYLFPLLKGKGYSNNNPYRGLKRIREDQITRITGNFLPLIRDHLEEDFHNPLQKLSADPALPAVKVHITAASITSRERNISLPPLVT